MPATKSATSRKRKSGESSENDNENDNQRTRHVVVSINTVATLSRIPRHFDALGTEYELFPDFWKYAYRCANPGSGEVPDIDTVSPDDIFKIGINLLHGTRRAINAPIFVGYAAELGHEPAKRIVTETKTLSDGEELGSDPLTLLQKWLLKEQCDTLLQ